ncbi:hypothetical protein, partial [Tamilnaduibacter salinus]|uniref:hypothetical protein n=1 Tax=Tamilnaduibacter salinus TaxID=1484056 RepID=UPI001B7FFEAC
MTVTEQEMRYLSQLLEACQRCVFFLSSSSSKILWPLDSSVLEQRNKDAEFFETLSAVNERFAKLQDTLALSMRHAAELLGEPVDYFLKVIVLFEKLGVISSREAWQEGRVVRNMAAHDYETDYQLIAEHFNALHELEPMLYQTAANLMDCSEKALGDKTGIQTRFSLNLMRLSRECRLP